MFLKEGYMTVVSRIENNWLSSYLAPRLAKPAIQYRLTFLVLMQCSHESLICALWLPILHLLLTQFLFHECFGIWI